MIASRRVMALLGAVMVAGLVACAPGPAATPSPTPVVMSEEEAFAAAEEVYRAYNEAQNQVNIQDPHTFEALAEYTTSEYFANERKALSELHAEKITTGGRAEIEWFEFESYERGVELVARSCVNISQVTYVDESGESVVPADRVTRLASNLTFEPQGNRWVLSKTTAIEHAKCLPY